MFLLNPKYFKKHDGRTPQSVVERCLAVVTESSIAVVRLILNEVDCRLMTA